MVSTPKVWMHEPMEQYIAAAETVYRLCKDEDAVVKSANKYKEIHEEDWTWETLSKIGNPQTALHAVIDPRCMAIKDAMEVEWEGFHQDIVEFMDIRDRDMNLPTLPMIDVGTVKVANGRLQKIVYSF